MKCKWAIVIRKKCHNNTQRNANESNDVLSFSSSQVCKIKKNDTSVTEEDLRKEIPQKGKKKKENTRKERIKMGSLFLETRCTQMP